MSTRDACLQYIRGLGFAKHLQSRCDGIYIFVAQGQIADVARRLALDPVRVDTLKDIFAVVDGVSTSVYYIFYSTLTKIRYVMHFLWDGTPVTSLHNMFVNAAVLQKEVIEKNAIPFLHTYCRDVFPHQLPDTPQGEGAFRHILWGSLEQQDMCVIEGTCCNEVVNSAFVYSGLLHRNIEKIMESCTMHQGLLYMSRLDQNACIAQEYAYVRAIEHISGICAPLYAQWVRLVVSEIERNMAHMRALTSVLLNIGFTPMIKKLYDASKLFHQIIRSLRAPFSGYFLYPGGVRQGVDADMHVGIDRWCHLVETFGHFIDRWCIKRRMLEKRIKGIGPLGYREALSIGCSGPVLRATGSQRDVRADEAYDAYAHVSLRVPMEDMGCAYARFLVVFQELLTSVSCIRKACDAMREVPKVLSAPQAPYQSDKSKIMTQSAALMRHNHLYAKGFYLEGSAYGCVEGPGGEKGVSVHVRGYQPHRIKVRPSTLPHMIAFERLSKNVSYGDIKILLASLGIANTEIDR